MAALTDRFPPDTKWRIGHFGVMAAVAAFSEGEPWLDRLLATLDHRRALLSTLLWDRLPAVAWHPPEATFLAWLDCSALGPDNQARDRFLERGRVALEPGLRFGAGRQRLRPAELRHQRRHPRPGDGADGGVCQPDPGIDPAERNPCKAPGTAASQRPGAPLHYAWILGVGAGLAALGDRAFVLMAGLHRLPGDTDVLGLERGPN